MNPLPLVLHQEILSFLNDNDGFEYCKVSKKVKCEIGKRVGSITLLNKKNIKDFLTSESHRTDILKNLHDSFRQLNICHYEPRDFVITSFDRDEAYNRFDEGSLASLPSFSLHSLCAKSREVFIILQNIKRIHKLTLHNPNPKDTSFSERDSDLFYRIVHLLSSPDHDYGLKELILYYFPISSIPIFPNLIKLELFGINNITAEQINISSFPHLRRLKLSGCSGIVDVTSLRYIYDLEIASCNGIIDISPLNNNYRVTIKTCQRIHDFSRSFQFSREICLKPIFFNPQETKPLDLNRLQAVVSLEIESEFCKTLPIVHNGTFPPSLRTLILEKLQFSFPLPETHNLKFIQLHRCNEVSLVNMTKIAKVVLIECNDIRFYSRLSHNKFVRIVNCNFRDSKGLHNIKHLEVKMPLDLNQPEIRNITHLCYDLWMALDRKRFDSLLRSLLLSKVQTLEFNVGIDVNIAVDLILTLLIQLKRDRILQKVVIRIVGRRVIRYFAQDLGRAETFQQLADVYNIEYTSNYRELVLLKKRIE